MFQVSLDHAERAEYTIFFLHFEGVGNHRRYAREGTAEILVPAEGIEPTA